MTKIAASQRQEVADLCAGGLTRREVAARFGVTEACIGSILSKFGLTRSHAPLAIRADARKAKNDATEARIRRSWDMSVPDYKAHVAEFGASTDRSSPMAKYRSQQSTATRRGIAWNFTFAEWWRVWQESGKWADRNKGGYVMARFNDGDTPYSASTVYICTQTQNLKDGFAKTSAAEREAKARITRANKAAAAEYLATQHPGA